MTNFFSDFVKNLKDEDTFLAEDGESSAEFTGYIDTGSYSLNALLSGSIYGGLPNTKRLLIGGETSVGKSFIALSALREFQKNNSTAGAILYDTETAQTKSMLTDRGIDASRVIISEQSTVEGFRTHALRFARAYLEMPEAKRAPVMMILDSLGNLSTKKEMGDIEEGNSTRDMTKQQLLRGAFRALNNPLARARIPMFIISHVYEKIGSYIPEKVVSGGEGAKYIADIIVALTKAQDKNTKTNEVVGAIVTAKTTKSRFTREKANVKIRIKFDSGIDRYYGLVNLAERGGLFKKVSKRYELPDGSSAFESHLEDQPEKYFTKDILDKIDIIAGDLFKYGGKLGEYADMEVVEE